MLGSGGGRTLKQKLGKDTLAVELWASGQIEATPYGTFARIMNKSKSRGVGCESSNGGDKKNATLHSSVVFDHFSFPRGRAALDPEMPRGKRIHPINMHANPAKTLSKLPADAREQLADIKPPEDYAFDS